MLIVPAYAKVNLALEVLGRRSDGYHEVATVITAIDWHDLVAVHVTRGEGGVTVHITGGEREWAAPGELVHAAASALAALAGRASDLRIHVFKRLPVAAGLGGGSADAAAVLRAGAAQLRTLGIDIDVAELGSVAASLGSDVPAMLAAGAVLATGRGEQLRPLPPPSLHLAVAVIASVSTGAAYGALCAEELGSLGRVDRVAAALAAGTTPAEADLGSALETAACRASPALGEALVTLRRTVPGVAWHLTGSGGAAFASARDAAAARRLAAAVRAAGFPARPCRTLGVPVLADRRAARVIAVTGA